MTGASGATPLMADLVPLAAPVDGALRQYYSGTLVSIAVAALLAAAVPLALAERGRAQFAEPGLTLVWLINYAVFGYAVGGILVWAAGVRPLTAFAVAVLPFLAWHAALRWERHRPAGRPRPPAEGPGDDIESRMVEAILGYAEILAQHHKDRALLAVRASVSRTLHLLGAHRQRVRLGTLSLHAAQRVRDLEAEVSILLDDLGWANHEVGDQQQARQSITEAIELLQEAARATPDTVPVAVRLLLVRGHRHLGAMTEPADLASALAHLAQAEAVVAELPAEIQTTERAALDVVRGDVVATHFADTRGPAAHFPVGSEDAVRVAEEMSRVDAAVDVLEAAGDLERAAKAAAIHQRLAAHQQSRRVREASLARLERLERTVVRDIERWRGGAGDTIRTAVPR